MKRFHLFLTVLLAVEIIFMGSSGVSYGILRSEILNVAKYNVMTSADPHTSTYNDMSMYIDGNIYEGLVTISPEDITKVEPTLAISWTVSSDGLTYIFNLRKGVKFSDGTPFNGEAVKFNFERLLDLKKGGSYGGLKVVDKVEVLDEHKVQIRLKQNFPFLAVARYSFMVSPTAVKNHATAEDKWAQNWLANHSAGTAPYMIQDWAQEVNITLIQNPHYWRKWKANQFKLVNIRSIYESDVQRMLLEKGDLDIAMIISRDSIAELKKNPKVWITQNISPAPMYLLFNFLTAPTNNMVVRKALAHAWNHEAYLKARSGLAPRADGPVPALLLGKDYRLNNPYHYDLNKAKELLSNRKTLKALRIVEDFKKSVDENFKRVETFFGEGGKSEKAKTA